MTSEVVQDPVPVTIITVHSDDSGENKMHEVLTDRQNDRKLDNQTA